ncbi:helix-turn-helix domain-containing protein [Acinetobacter sp. ANC 4779]|uniref:LexA family protein n=1 Tax=Acinetobacter sp. ANC 4779 TaxID=2529848 RepID=UPI00103EF1E5|nr:LexA family transcriptional regulator [Acinetobacter sp. ANC 4779]TCB50994.1 helix-turn-helix domain-containing protein [Acinetobacter sp. ANC 4779]
MSFHLRLQEKLKEKGYKPADLARATEVSGVAVGKWIHGDSQPKAGKLKLIARFLGVSDDWLLTGKEAPVRFDNNIDLSQKFVLAGRPIPVISWVAAGSFGDIETVLKDAEIDEYLPPIKECGKNGYGLIVVGNSMKPDFKPGDRIYVNPDIQTFDLQTDDLVIIACSGETEATFKKLIIEGGDKYLQPLNPNWPEQIIKLTEDCRLVGKVVGLYRKI